MAVTARFGADFQDFYTAVQKADTQLRGFEGSATKVGSSLNKMADSLSGTKIVSEATLMAKAVEEVGGVSKLTEKELQKVASTAQEAATKLKAMGQDVPPGIRRLADEAERAQSIFGTWGEQIATTAAGFVTAQAIIAGVTTVVKALGNEFVTLTLHGAAVADVSDNFDRLAVQAGHVGDTLLGQLRAGTHATITDFELMKTVNQDLAAGLNLTDQQFGTLAKGAFSLAQATGTNVKDALDTMNDAMLTGRTRALALLTGKIDLEAAENRYAAMLGTSRKELTETQKLEAARVAILDAVTAATGRLGEQTDGLDEIVAQAQTAWANFEDQLGKALNKSEVLMTGLQGLKRILADTFGGTQEDAIKAIVTQVEALAVSLIDLGITGARVMGVLVKGTADVAEAYRQLSHGFDFVLLALKGVELAGHQVLRNTDMVKKVEGELREIGERLRVYGLRVDETGDAHDRADQKVEQYVKQLEALKSQMIESGKATNGFVGPLQATVLATTNAAVAAPKLARSLHEANNAIGLVVGNTEEETEALLNVAGATDTWGLGIGQLNRRVPELTAYLEEQARVFADLVGYLPPIVTALEDIDRTEQNLKRTHDALRASFDKPMMLPDVKPAMQEATAVFDEIKDAASSMLGGLNDIFQRAFEGGGGMLGAIQSFATQAGKLFLSFIPVVGPILSQFSGAIVAGFSKLIGLFKSAEEKINPLRKAFVDAAGGLDQLRNKATAAGVTINALLNAKNAQQYEQAIKDLNQAFADTQKELEGIDKLKGEFDKIGGALSDSMRDALRQLGSIPGLSNDAKAALMGLANDTKPNFAALEKIAEGYGITLANLGGKFQQAHLSDEAAKIIGDFENLKNAGADVGGVINGMADEVQHVVDESAKFGIDVPANMQPMIEAMINAGLLTDEAGNKIKDIGQIKFGAPVETEADKIVKAIKDLGEIFKGLPGIADKAAKGINDGLNTIKVNPVHVPVILDFPTTSAIHVPAAAVAAGPSAAGFSAANILPFRAPATLSRAEVRTLGGASAARTPVTTPAAAVTPTGDLDAVIQQLRALRAELPKTLVRAVRDDRQKFVGRR